MLAGKLCFSQCELVVLPPRLHDRLFSIHSMAIVTVCHKIGGKGMAEERLPGREVHPWGTFGIMSCNKAPFNYLLKIIIFLICLLSLAKFSVVLPVFHAPFVYLFICFCTTPPHSRTIWLQIK